MAQKHITFGSFQKVNKMNSDVFAVWAAVLKALPTATLRLQAVELVDDRMRAYVIKQLEVAGIESDRVILNSAQTRKDYLSAYGEVDIVLDTFPFPGGTTTCEALWMGVPTITLAGNTMIARQGASLLACVGLKEWVANTEEEYINIAINKAGDIKALAQLRAELREQVRASPLFNAELFARDFEDAMFAMRKLKTAD